MIRKSKGSFTTWDSQSVCDTFGNKIDINFNKKDPNYS